MAKSILFQKWAKRIVFFIFLIELGSAAYSQKLSFIASVDSSVTNFQMSYNINIVINDGTPDFSVAIYEKEPWNGGRKLFPAETIKTSSYTFRNLKKGKYFVCIKDVTENGVCKWVIIE